MRGAASPQLERARLLRALTLSRRFHLYLVTCPHPRSADELVSWLSAELPKARGSEVQLVRLDPHAGRDASTPLTREEIAPVLTAMVTPTHRSRDVPAVYLLDTSRARTEDEAAWRWFFERWNEQRNVVQNQLEGELVVLLAPSLVLRFAETAPDVWSTRSGEYELEDQDIDRHIDWIGGLDLKWRGDELEVNALHSGVAGRLVQVISAPLGAQQMIEAFNHFSEGTNALSHGNYTHAHRCIVEALGVLDPETPADGVPRGMDATRASVNFALARCECELGALSEALAAFERAAAWSDPGSLDWAEVETQIAVIRVNVLEQWTQLDLVIGELERAERHAEEEVLLRRLFAPQKHDEAKLLQAVVVLRCGNRDYASKLLMSLAVTKLVETRAQAELLELRAEVDARHSEHAVQLYEQALVKRREDTTAGAAGRLALTLVRAARLHWLRGHREAGVAYLSEASALWREEKTSYLTWAQALLVLQSVDETSLVEPYVDELRALMTARRLLRS